MHKLINGKRVPVSEIPAAEKAAKPAAQSGAAGKAVDNRFKQDVSRAALELMARQPQGLDWTGLKGSGQNGQITVKDVKEFLGK